MQKNIEGNTLNDADGEEVLQGVDDRAACDAVLNQMEVIKDLWKCDQATGNEGPLRSKLIAGCAFSDPIQDQPFDPFSMVRRGVMSSIIEVQYTPQ